MTMTKLEVMTLTRTLLRKQGVNDFIIGFNTNRTRLGVCKHHKRTIEYSELIFKHLERDEIVQTIIHEVAHAAVGPGFGHGPIWQRKYAAMGGTRGRTANLPQEVRHAISKYVIHCAVTGDIIAYRNRRRADGWSCLCHKQNVRVVEL